MKFVCGPAGFMLPVESADLAVDLYAQPLANGRASAGESARSEIVKRRLHCSQRAWDFLSIALSVVTADFASLRSDSPDGWTRELELDIAVADDCFWNAQATPLARTLAFLTTDLWTLRFHGGGQSAPQPARPVQPKQDCVALFSGGLDSLVGAIDLASVGRNPMAVSQVVKGDAGNQRSFAGQIAGGLKHLQLSHAAFTPGSREPSQRARSLIFIAFGVLAATTLVRYHDGDVVPLFACENGFIALNPPLTGGRIGSLSTRTAHPEFLGRLQRILNAAGLRVTITNPYVTDTKGEMLLGCSDQALLTAIAADSTSCARFLRFGYRHCGRCVPCQVRRAAFMAWGVPDTTEYIYDQIGLPGLEHSGFDDVRSVALALATIQAQGIDGWLRGALSSAYISDRALLSSMVGRAMGELQSLHRTYGVT